MGSTLVTTVAVAHDQLAEFKGLSHRFFELLANETKHDKVPKRNGLDVFSFAFGFSSHPDLVTHSKGVESTVGLSDKIQNNKISISSRLALKMDHDSPHLYLSLISIIAPAIEKSRSDFLEHLSAFTEASENYKTASIFHKAYLSGDYDLCSTLIREHSWTPYEIAKQEWLAWHAVNIGCTEDVEYLCKIGVINTNNINKVLYEAISKIQIECSISLIKHGADLNANVDVSKYNSLAYDVLEEQACRPLLEYAITNQLLNREDYLSWLCRGTFNANIPLIDKVSTQRDRENAFYEAVSHGKGYSAAFFLHEYPDIIFNIQESLRSYSGDRYKLPSVIRVLNSFPHASNWWSLDDLLIAIIQTSHCHPMLEQDRQYLMGILLEEDDNSAGPLAVSEIVDTVNMLGSLSCSDTLFKGLICFILEENLTSQLKMLTSDKVVDQITDCMLRVLSQELPPSANGEAENRVVKEIFERLRKAHESTPAVPNHLLYRTLTNLYKNGRGGAAAKELLNLIEPQYSIGPQDLQLLPELSPFDILINQRTDS